MDLQQAVQANVVHRRLIFSSPSARRSILSRIVTFPKVLLSSPSRLVAAMTDLNERRCTMAEF
jgi:hypothetical protein